MNEPDNPIQNYQQNVNYIQSAELIQNQTVEPKNNFE